MENESKSQTLYRSLVNSDFGLALRCPDCNELLESLTCAACSAKAGSTKHSNKLISLGFLLFRIFLGIAVPLVCFVAGKLSYGPKGGLIGGLIGISIVGGVLKGSSLFSGQNLIKGDALNSLAKKYYSKVETYDMAAICYIKLFAKNANKDKRAIVNTVSTDFINKYCLISLNEIQQTLRDIIFINTCFAFISNIIDRPIVENFNQSVAFENLKKITNSSPSQIQIAKIIRDEMIEKYNHHPSEAVDKSFMKPLRGLFEFAPEIANKYTIPPNLSK